MLEDKQAAVDKKGPDIKENQVTTYWYNLYYPIF